MIHKFSNIYVITAFLVIGGLLQGFDISSLFEILSTKPYKRSLTVQQLINKAALPQVSLVDHF